MMITFLLSGMEHFAMKSSIQGDPGVHGMLGTIGQRKGRIMVVDFAF